jgi:hypothetical protein
VPQRRRRRMLSPSSLTRESTTWVSGALQKGHFIAAREARGKRREARGKAADR